jgi:hypothetical protein
MMLPSYFGAMQGRNEQRSEVYLQYIERAAEFLTPQCAKNINGVLYRAQEQVDVVWRQQ